MEKETTYKKIENICLAFKNEESIVQYFTKFEKKYRKTINKIDELKKSTSRINEIFPVMKDIIKPYSNDPYFFIYALFGHWGSEEELEQEQVKRFYDDYLIGMSEELKSSKEFAICIYSIGNKLNELGIETNYNCALRFFNEDVMNDYDVCQNAIKNDNIGTLYFLPYIKNEESLNKNNNALISISKMSKRNDGNVNDLQWYLMRHPSFLNDREYISSLLKINPHFISDIPKEYLDYKLIGEVINNLDNIDKNGIKILDQVDCLILKYNELKH